VRAPVRLLTATLAVLTAAACGNEPTQRAQTAGERTTTNAAWTVDATGQVSCSAGKLPRRPGPAVLTAELDGTTAVLSGRTDGDRYLPVLRSPRLTVRDAQQSSIVQLRPDRFAYQHRYIPAQLTLDRQVRGYVCLLRTEDGPPVAVVSVYAGGAHCCTTVQLADATGKRTHLETGNAGARLAVLDGHALLRTGDDSFNYVFTDFADSCSPVVLRRPSTTDLGDVTTSYPGVLRADAQQMWTWAQRRTLRQGLIACWAADEIRLGHEKSVWTTLHRLVAAGKLDMPRAQSTADWVGGSAYVAKLRRFLAAHGYRAG